LARSGAEPAGQAPEAEPTEDPGLSPSALRTAPSGSSTENRLSASRAQKAAWVQTASAAVTAKRAAPAKCRVWTASYGGQRAIIIKAISEQHTNYTVLDVNEGAEKREAEAYIAAYAKGGQPVGEFANQSLALERAFEFCPEG
jgi:hypothetical protein